MIFGILQSFWEPIWEPQIGSELGFCSDMGQNTYKVSYLGAQTELWDRPQHKVVSNQVHGPIESDSRASGTLFELPDQNTLFFPQVI